MSDFISTQLKLAQQITSGLHNTLQVARLGHGCPDSFVYDQRGCHVLKHCEAMSCASAHATPVTFKQALHGARGTEVLLLMLGLEDIANAPSPRLMVKPTIWWRVTWLMLR
eukprot:1517-Heterococcus_DN1.PRE.2